MSTNEVTAVKKKSVLAEKLKSRTFWFGLLGAIGPIVFQAVSGKIGWPVAIGGSVTAIVSYIFGEKFLDGKKAEALPKLIEALNKTEDFTVSDKIKDLLNIK